MKKYFATAAVCSLFFAHCGNAVDPGREEFLAERPKDLSLAELLRKAGAARTQLESLRNGVCELYLVSL